MPKITVMVFLDVWGIHDEYLIFVLYSRLTLFFQFSKHIETQFVSITNISIFVHIQEILRHVISDEGICKLIFKVGY